MNSLLICTATVKPQLKPVKPSHVIPPDNRDAGQDIVLHKDDIYKYFRIKGYDYEESFQCIKEYNLSSNPLFLSVN